MASGSWSPLGGVTTDDAFALATAKAREVLGATVEAVMVNFFQYAPPSTVETNLATEVVNLSGTVAGSAGYRTFACTTTLDSYAQFYWPKNDTIRKLVPGGSSGEWFLEMYAKHGQSGVETNARVHAGLGDVSGQRFQIGGRGNVSLTNHSIITDGATTSYDTGVPIVANQWRRFRVWRKNSLTYVDIDGTVVNPAGTAGLYPSVDTCIYGITHAALGALSGAHSQSIAYIVTAVKRS